MSTVNSHRHYNILLYYTFVYCISIPRRRAERFRPKLLLYQRGVNKRGYNTHPIDNMIATTVPIYARII